MCVWGGAGWKSLFQELYLQVRKGAGVSICQGFPRKEFGSPCLSSPPGMGVGAPTCSWLEQPYWMSGVKVVSCSSASVCSSCPTKLGILVTL